MPEQPENRVERIVNGLLRGRRLKLRAGDAEEKEAITAAARLAAAHGGPQRMSPAFRRRLAQTLESAPRDSWITRRAALVAGLGVAAGALAGGGGGGTIEARPPQLFCSRPTHPPKGGWADGRPLAGLEGGRGKLVPAGAGSAFVFL